MFQDHKAGFGLISISLHWVSTMLIVFLFGLGLYMVDLSYYETWYHKGPSLHISLGLLLLLLTLFRILCRLTNRHKPEPLPEQSLAIRLLSGTAHYSLHALVLVIIASGYLVTTAKGDPASLFGWIEFPALIGIDNAGVDLAGKLHYGSACAIIVLSAFHASAALLHHFVLRDQTLMRILDPRKGD